MTTAFLTPAVQVARFPARAPLGYVDGFTLGNKEGSSSGIDN